MEPVGIFMGICIDLSTKYHAKIDIFLIDSEQIKYLPLTASSLSAKTLY
jgi:hypothetical protein